MSADNEQCPKTVADNITLKSHPKIITQAVAQWLEDMHQLTADSHSLKQSAPGDIKNDLKTYEVLFDHLRGGKLQEAQQFLLEIGSMDKYMQLIGNLPFFDNIQFEQQTQSENLFIQDSNHEKQIVVDYTSKKLLECGKNVLVGNRNNLLFVETCIARINDSRLNNQF